MNAKKITIAFSILIAGIVILQLFTFSKITENTNTNLHQAIENYNVYAVKIPASINFAGEEVPIEEFDVFEKLDKELLINTYYQSNTLLYHKRANRWFPIIEPILKRHGIPEDFKYLPVIESGFTNVTSPAGASGFWQFLSSTGKQYGLTINDEVDERYHIEKATLAACKYLNYAYKIFGNWTMVAASYNMGYNGLKNQVEKQDVNSYYDLLLNEETSRYLFRILAVKLILASPNDYGYHFNKKDLYPQLETYKVKIDSSIPNLAVYAKSIGINYKILKICNPWLRSNALTLKAGESVLIDIPKNKNLYKQYFIGTQQLKEQGFLPNERNESLSLNDSMYTDEEIVMVFKSAPEEFRDLFVSTFPKVKFHEFLEHANQAHIDTNTFFAQSIQ
jgi:membrane-bound lytic murein transglycosylase D